MKKSRASDNDILNEIRFGFLHTYAIAGMAEPWHSLVPRTLGLLEGKGIGSILTLTEDDLYGDQYIQAGFLHHHEPVDDCFPPTAEGMERALSFIDSSIKKGRPVAVHCLEGRGRTGTVLCAWLALKESLDFERALERVHELRECTVLTESQRKFLRDFLAEKG